MIMKKTWTMILMAVALFVLPSCSDDDEYYYDNRYANAIVTLKTNPETKQFYMQLDDETILRPTNLSTSPYGDKEVRALINFDFEDERATQDQNERNAHVYWIDTIRTKNMAISQEDNVKAYGNDPVEIVKHWTTVVEDGYLTLRFRTKFGYGVEPHELNLVKGENPYEVILHHNAKGDLNGVPRDGMIAFRLNDLPDTQGETVDLKIKWYSYQGDKEVIFKYRSRD